VIVHADLKVANYRDIVDEYKLKACHAVRSKKPFMHTASQRITFDFSTFIGMIPTDGFHVPCSMFHVPSTINEIRCSLQKWTDFGICGCAPDP
jgi:hypothetical protein